MRFPFDLCDEEQHVTKPDIIATIPDLPCDIPPLRRWRNVALVFMAKPCDTDDPMKTYSDENEATLIQLAKSARNIMLAQGRLYAFVVGIYGHQARIFYLIEPTPYVLHFSATYRTRTSCTSSSGASQCFPDEGMYGPQ